jgi:hypothetical protein
MPTLSLAGTVTFSKPSSWSFASPALRWRLAEVNPPESRAQVESGVDAGVWVESGA